MPLFYFDIQDGSRLYSDDEGLEKADAEAARKDLVSTLAQLAKDRLPDGLVSEFHGTLKDESGKALFEATLSLRSGWVE